MSSVSIPFDAKHWISRRPATIALVLFFVAWFVLQLVTKQFVGQELAQWWFYAEHHGQFPPEFQPGFLVSPISHAFDDPTHLPVNVMTLLIAGGLAEPRIGPKRVLIIVIGIGYVGTFLANATLLLHAHWTYAGASVGIFALWSYTGPRLSQLLHRFTTFEDGRWALWEAFWVLVVGMTVPIMILYEIFINWNVGHLTGFLLGYLYYALEWLYHR